VFVALDGIMAGVLRLADEIRPETPRATRCAAGRLRAPRYRPDTSLFDEA
jgi:cation transport ATPase